jgi:hypothetical protein
MSPRKRIAATRSRPDLWVRVAKIGWWVVCLGILTWWIFALGIEGADAAKSGPEWLTFMLAMGVISFPAGPLWLWALPSIREALPAAGVDLSLLPWYWEPVAAWLGVAILGYAQWFWLVPGVLRLRASE